MSAPNRPIAPDARATVLPPLTRATRLRALTGLVGVVLAFAGVGLVTATDNAWVHEGEQTVQDSESAETGNHPNECEGEVGIPFGEDPGWARVGGSSDPHAPIIEVSGQILDPHAYVVFDEDDEVQAAGKTNAFVNHTDNTFNHWARDVNIFLTLDPEDRWALSEGSFVEGDSNELGHFEIEWERGSIPMFAFPAMGDRATVWGPHIWDCGHGDTWVELSGDDDDFRTEIHPPMGWVLFRHSADADGEPDNDKQHTTPWNWYSDTDHQGQGGIVPSSGLLFTPVQSTVADTYFSSYGGNVIESLNGCDDDGLDVGGNDFDNAECYDDIDDGAWRSELNNHEDDTWEWNNPVLDNDYTFIVPAPDKPSGAAGDTPIVWEATDKCSGVPADPTYPNKNDHEEASDGVEGDDLANFYHEDDPDLQIGAATCNPAPGGALPYVVIVDQTGTAAWNTTDRPAIQVTVRARTGNDGIDGNSDDPVYPANDYVAFAYRFTVAWDHVPAAADMVRTYQVNFDDLRVYDDAEPCIGFDVDDGEWVMSLRANDQYIHPVEGTGQDDNDGDDTPEPFWASGAVDDALCDGGGDDEYQAYTLGADGAAYITRFVDLLPGQQIEIWDKSYDKDGVSDDDTFDVYHAYYDPPVGGSAGHVLGEANDNDEGNHTITFQFHDVTLPQPATGTLDFGDPQFGPDAVLTNGLLRVSGETPVTLDQAAADGLEFRVWKQGDAVPGWSFDFSAPFEVALPDDPVADNGVYTIEWASIEGSGVSSRVSQRARVSVELDNQPPTLTVPDDFEVFADQTAGKVVEYTVTVTDNFPGPVTWSCVPPSGSLFANGKNAPLVHTVNCSAKDAVDNEATDSFTITVVSPFGYIPDFVVLGRDWARLGGGTVVTTGNIGAFDASSGVPNTNGFEVVTGSSVLMTGGPQIAAYSEQLGNATQAGDVFHVGPLVLGNGATAIDKIGYVPLFYDMPAVPAFTAGGLNKSFSGTGAGNVLAAGTYGKLSLSANARVTLTGGAYFFTAIEVKSGATLDFAAASSVHVTGRVLFGNGSIVGPATGSGIGARDIVLYSLGTDGPSNKPSDAIQIGSQSHSSINAYAVNGTMSIGSYGVGHGAFLGKRVAIAENVVLTLDSSFLCP